METLYVPWSPPVDARLALLLPLFFLLLLHAQFHPLAKAATPHSLFSSCSVWAKLFRALKTIFWPAAE